MRVKKYKLLVHYRSNSIWNRIQKECRHLNHWLNDMSKMVCVLNHSLQLLHYRWLLHEQLQHDPVQPIGGNLIKNKTLHEGFCLILDLARQIQTRLWDVWRHWYIHQETPLNGVFYWELFESDWGVGYSLTIWDRSWWSGRVVLLVWWFAGRFDCYARVHIWQALQIRTEFCIYSLQDFVHWFIIFSYVRSTSASPVTPQTLMVYDQTPMEVWIHVPQETSYDYDLRLA